MKKNQYFALIPILAILVLGCPVVTPGLLHITLPEVPEWIEEVPASDAFTPNTDIQEYFNVSYWDGDNLKEREYSDEDGECWFELKNLESSAARLYLYFGDSDRFNSNWIFLGETYDSDYILNVVEKDGVFEFDCNSNSISPVYSESVDKDEYGWYKIKHMKFVKLEGGYNLYLTVDGKVLGPYHFSKTQNEVECKQS